MIEIEFKDLKHKTTWIPNGKMIPSYKQDFDLERAIIIYEIIKEYKELEEDYKNCSQGTRTMIEEKLKELYWQLMSFYVITDGDLIERESEENNGKDSN